MSTQKALLDFINSFPEAQPFNVTNFVDLRDGKALASVWNAVNPNQINIDTLGTPSNQSDWLTILKNLREVDKVMSPILTEKGFREKVELTKISRQGDEEELIKFVSPIIIIAATSPMKAVVVSRIKSLSPDNRNAIQVILKKYVNKKKEMKPQSTQSTDDLKKAATALHSPSLNASKSSEAPPILSSVTSPEVKLNNSQSTEQPPSSNEQQKSSVQSHMQVNQPNGNQSKPATKIEDLEILIQQAEVQISSLRKEIENNESQLSQLQEQANKKYKKADHSKAQMIDQAERMLYDLTNENTQNQEKLDRLKQEDSKVQNELTVMRGRVDVLQELAQKTLADHQKKRQLVDLIKKLEDAIAENLHLDDQIRRQEDNLKKRQGVSLDAKTSEHFNQLDDKEEILTPEQLDKEIENLKEDITTSIMLAEKYGNVSDEIQPAENENHETVPELATRITQMEIELAVVKDAVQSGHSGIPPDLLKEQKELTKVIKKLLERKEQLQRDAKTKDELRSDMRRVQQTMIEQREEIDQELEKLTDDINVRNVDLANWLSFSSSFEAWKNSSTFLADLRSNFL